MNGPGHEIGAVKPSRRVLVVDSQGGMSALATHFLQRMGLSGARASNRSELIAMFETFSPEVVVADLLVGDMDIVQLCHALKERGFDGCLILMSEHSMNVIHHACRIAANAKLRVGGVLRKPLGFDEFRTMLQRCVTRREDLEPTEGLLSGKNLLKQAIEENWVEFWFQPKVFLDTGIVEGAECLARINHPEHGIISPHIFLDDATEEALRDLVLLATRSAVDLSEELEGKYRTIPLSINVSARNLHNPSLIADLKTVRDRRKQSPNLVLEITETDATPNHATLEEFATRAILHGFGISIDDFGSGYSIFDRLRFTPFSELKLDRSVVHGCASDRSLKSICQAAVQLAHDFNAIAVAEGVERPEDAETLRKLGFDVAQGYLFSPPLKLDKFLIYLGKI